jgi:uncharacterized membrane protein
MVVVVVVIVVVVVLILVLVLVLVIGSRGSSVSIVSDYGLDDRGSIPDRSRGFFL